MAENIEGGKHVTMDLSRRIISYGDGVLDAATLTVAKQCILDWFAVSVAASSTPSP